jgi:excisionase family DNA binding protein
MLIGKKPGTVDVETRARRKRGHEGLGPFGAADLAAERSLKTRCISVRQTAQILGKSPDAVRALIHRKVIPARKVGRNLLINLEWPNDELKFRSNERSR